VRTKLPKRLKRHVARWRREAAQAEPATLPRVPAHCDLNISNLLAAPDGRLLAVLDFDAARMAPRHMDFRKFWVVDAAFRDDVVAAYAAAGGAPPDEELLARAELLMLLKSARAASRGHARERAAFERLAGNRLRLERTARWRRMLRIRRPGRAQARPMAETVAIQTIE
jgi:aminoglycoside phosphotransferase (APT) family kinase protein